MDYREKSEIRDGMRIDWDMPITDGRRPGAAMRHLPADRRRQISGDHDLWALRQVAALRGPLHRPVAAHVRRPAGRADRLDQQVSVLGGGRSGEMGAGRLRLHPRRQPRRRPLARRHRHLVAARGAGSGAMRRLGRRAALVERQGRPQRHLLLCREPVADGRAAAQASRRDLHMGGRRRFLPRHGAPRRHLLPRLRAGLVEGAGLHRAERARHAAASRAA